MTEVIDAQQLIARTLRLLSRAAIQGVCKGRMRELIRHLEYVARDPSVDPAIRATAGDLVKEWRVIQEREFGERKQAGNLH
jgi:hypothetical protein